MAEPHQDSPAGLPGDPLLFKVLTEISIISNLADREFERRMPGALTMAQFAVLNHLLRLDEQQTIGEIARAMQVAQPTMSSTVKKLEAKKYVRLVADAGDRRVRRVAVTAAGRRARDAAVKAVAPGLASLGEATKGVKWERALKELATLRQLLDAARD